MKTKICKCIISFLLFIFLCSGESFSPLRFQQYTTDNGLSDNNVSAIIQDHFGYLWFGTYNGLNRYDGQSFKIYKHIKDDSSSIAYNKIAALFEDSRHRIWISATTVSVYDPIADSFQNFKTSKNDLSSLPSTGVTGFAEDKNKNIWMSCRAFETILIEYENSTGKFKSFTVPEILGGVKSTNKYRGDCIVIHDEKIFMGTQSGILVFNPSTLIFDTTAASPGSLTGGASRKIFFDREGVLWATTNNYGLARIDLNGKKCELFYDDSLKKFNSAIASFINKSDNELWLGLYGVPSVLYVFDFVTHTFHPCRKDYYNGTFPGVGNIQAIFKDRNETCWFGTNQGIVKFDPRANLFKTIHLAEGRNLKNDFNAGYFLKDDSTGSIFISNSSGEGLFVLDSSGKHCEQLSPHKGITEQNNIDEMIKLHDGRLLLNFKDSLYVFNPQTKSYSCFPLKLPFHWDNFESIIEDNKHCIWIGTNEEGVFRVDADWKTIHSYPHDANAKSFPLSNAALQTADDDGHIWCNTFDSVCYYDPALDCFHLLSLPEGTLPVAKNAIRNISADHSSNVWISVLRKGILRYNYRKKEFKMFEQDGGLDDLNVYQSDIDSKENLWIRTLTGIYLFNTKQETFTLFTGTEGLYTDKYFYTMHVCGDMLCVGYVNDVMCYAKIAALEKNSHLPNTVISEVKVFSNPVRFRNNDDSYKSLQLNYDENQLSFEFAALNYTRADKNKYSFILEGLDRNRTITEAQNHASYFNIPPGSYFFRVRASNNDGVWSEKDAAISITIKPPWWLTWWFRLAVAAALVTTVLMIVREYTTRKLRLQRAELEKQQAVENVRNRISRDIHDEIGSSLTKISLMSEQLKSKVKENEAEGIIAKISSSSRGVIGNMSEIIWATNPQHDNLASMISYFRDYTSQLFSDTSVKCVIDFPEDVSELPVAPELRRNLFLVLKESLNNILKHAHASNVFVEMKIDAGEMRMVIKDNGMGFNPDENKKFSNGLKNMKKRMEEVGGRFEINSTAGNGTVCRITVKV